MKFEESLVVFYGVELAMSQTAEYVTEQLLDVDIKPVIGHRYTNIAQKDDYNFFYCLAIPSTVSHYNDLESKETRDALRRSTVPEEWSNRISEFCSKHGLAYMAPPAWNFIVAVEQILERWA
jgi:hypothetical protein